MVWKTLARLFKKETTKQQDISPILFEHVPGIIPEPSNTNFSWQQWALRLPKRLYIIP